MSSSQHGEVTIRRHPPSGATAGGAAAKPNNILEEIVWHKAVEIARWRATESMEAVEARAAAAPAPRDFIGALRAARAATSRPGLIAEVKKASPSRGVLQPNFDPVNIARGYAAGGAACLSVLTDARFFGGGFENLGLIREAGVALPLLCKEFVVDDYQVARARAAGADAILLIAAVLSSPELESLTAAAHRAGLAVLIEVHSVPELERVLALPRACLDPASTMLGINNRNLETFVVDLSLTTRIMGSAAGAAVKARRLLMAGESGIFTPDDVAAVAAAGCGAILVGESIVKNNDPEAAVRALLA